MVRGFSSESSLQMIRRPHATDSSELGRVSDMSIWRLPPTRRVLWLVELYRVGDARCSPGSFSSSFQITEHSLDVVEIHEVVDGNDGDVWVRERRSENHAADAAEAVDSNLAGRHS